MYMNVDAADPYGAGSRVYGAESAYAAEPANVHAGAPRPEAVAGAAGRSAPLYGGAPAAPPAPGEADEHEDDYVYFVRNTNNMSKATLEAARSAKIRLEHAYRLAVEQAIERSQRYVPD